MSGVRHVRCDLTNCEVYGHSSGQLPRANLFDFANDFIFNGSSVEAFARFVIHHGTIKPMIMGLMQINGFSFFFTNPPADPALWAHFPKGELNLKGRGDFEILKIE